MDLKEASYLLVGHQVPRILCTKPLLFPSCGAGAGPSPRSAHVASVFQGRYLLVFGGGSVAHCFDSLFMLDTETLEWSELQAEGPVPPPRAGDLGLATGM